MFFDDNVITVHDSQSICNQKSAYFIANDLPADSTICSKDGEVAAEMTTGAKAA